MYSSSKHKYSIIYTYILIFLKYKRITQNNAIKNGTSDICFKEILFIMKERFILYDHKRVF